MNIVLDVALVAAVVGYCVWIAVHRHKHRDECCGGCAGCAMAGSCHEKKQPNEK